MLHVYGKFRNLTRVDHPSGLNTLDTPNDTPVTWGDVHRFVHMFDSVSTVPTCDDAAACGQPPPSAVGERALRHYM